MKIFFAKEGYPYIIVFSILTWIFARMRRILGRWPFLITLSSLGFVSYFFRDPGRAEIIDPELVISPADGRIIDVEEVDEKEFLNCRCFKISIFLSIFDVHVNRAPISGRVEKIKYSPGRFRPAFDERASTENETNSILIRGERFAVVVKQIAGLIARRIVCYITEGMNVVQSQRIGMIKFGSRTELFIPVDSGFKPAVRKGDRVYGAETILGVVRRAE